MDRLIEAVIALLRTEGIYAVRAFPQGAMPALKAPCTAVGLSRAKGAGRAVYTYLGMEENADGTQTPLYGRALETEIFLQVFCPRGLGAQRCMEEAERVTTALALPSAIVKLGELEVGGCAYRAESDCYVCRLSVEAEAYVYAQANEEETEFTDFILKGEVK